MPLLVLDHVATKPANLAIEKTRYNEEKKLAAQGHHVVWYANSINLDGDLWPRL